MEETGCRAVITELARKRKRGFALERAVFLTVLHRLFVSGSDRAADRWREDYAIAGVEGLTLRHLNPSDGVAGRGAGGKGTGRPHAIFPALRVGKLRFFGVHAPLADAEAFAAFLALLRKTRWFVYAKRPFARPKAVLAYLSRYTHRVAISNSRLIEADAGACTRRNRRERRARRT